MKKQIKIIFLLALLVMIWGCPDNPSTPPPTVYNNNISVIFTGNWDRYECQDSFDGNHYPELLSNNFMIVSNDSLMINSAKIGGDENHGVFMKDNQIWYKDTDDNDIYQYDYFYNNTLDRLWLKPDTSMVVSFDYDPAMDAPDSLDLNDFYLLYKSTNLPAPQLLSPTNGSMINTLKPNFKIKQYDGATAMVIQVAEDSTFSSALAVSDTFNVNPDSLFSLYTPTNNLDNYTKYFWRIKANISNWTNAHDFTTFMLVSLISPLNAANTSRKPKFTWEAFPEATVYTIQVASSSDFNASSILTETTTSDLFYNMSTMLDVNTRYYWRIKNDKTEGNWSLIRSFLTQEKVILTSPSNDETGIDVSSLNFEWSELDNASSYHIQVASDEDLTNIVINQDNINEATYSSTDELDINTTYYWRVNSDVAADWSSVFNFVTNTTVFLTNPENSQEDVPLIENFEWDQLSETDNLYTIQLADNEDFNNAYEATVEHDASTNSQAYLVSDYLESDMQYYWRVKTDDGQWTDTWTFHTMATNVSSNLIIPANDADNIKQKPTFGWHDDLASYYELIVAKDDAFTETETVIDTIASDVEYNLTTSLEYGTTYYWKVKSSLTNWSTVYSFTVESGIPTNLTVNADSPLKFDIKWTNTTTSANGYFLERSEDGGTIWEVVVSDPTKLINKCIDFDKDPSKEYIYRVRATSDGGFSEYSEISDPISPLPFESPDMPELVDVTAGNFSMGSTDGDTDEAPIHDVTLTNDFKMGKYEVTVADFVNILNYELGKGLIKPHADFPDFYEDLGGIFPSSAISLKRLILTSAPVEFDFINHKFVCADADANKPIYDITYAAAALYCKSMNELLDYTGFYTISSSPTCTSHPYDGNGFRLPTEAEWEYVAKYNDTRIYPWGNDTPDKDHANYFGSGWGDMAIDVTSCDAGVNALGVYNLAGNVWEWCNDKYGDYPNEAVTNPEGPSSSISTSAHAVIRGGSYEMGATYMRTTNRANCKASLDAGKVNSAIGFRLVLLP